MKLKFLDASNCHELLPPVQGLSIISLLDDYLQQEINNDKYNEQHGSIDALIKQNARTRNRERGSLRLCDSPIDIALIFNATNDIIDFRSIVKPIKGPSLLHTFLIYQTGLTWKTIIPLQFLLKGWGDANYGYQCYVHSISPNTSQLKSYAEMRASNKNDSNNYHYVGITGRNWLLRLKEHMGEMRRGSRRVFHKAWRKHLGSNDIHYISQLADINLKYVDAMNWEELHVDQLGTNGLNMIPGGFKGLRLLHECRIINNMNISLEEREKAIAEYIRRNPRKGIPNPFIEDLWKDDDFYIKNIEAKQKTLSRSQVIRIRELDNKGWTVSEIAKEVDALNELQVKNVITGRYYNRVH